MEEPTGARASSFEQFAATVGVRVRRALVATYGVEIGTEAAADAMALAWERGSSIEAMDNSAGYLYRVGQTKARPHLRWRQRGGENGMAIQVPIARADALGDGAIPMTFTWDGTVDGEPAPPGTYYLGPGRDQTWTAERPAGPPPSQVPGGSPSGLSPGYATFVVP